MHLKLLVSVILCIYLLNLNFADENLSNGACRIISDVAKKEIWLKTVALVKLENSLDSKVIDDLIKCLPIDIAVVSIDIRNFNWKSSIRHKPSFVVVIVDNEKDFVQLFALVSDHQTIPFLNHNSKFLVLTTRYDQAFLDVLRRIFNVNLSITKLAILFGRDGKELIDFNGNPQQSTELESINGNLLDKLYRIKKNLNRNYYLAIHPEYPRVMIVNGKIRTRYNSFFKSAMTLENSTYSYVVLKGEIKSVANIVQDLLSTRKIEAVVSTIFLINSAAPKLMTYDETGFCLVVQNPEPLSLIDEMFFLPFDLAIWMALLLSMTVCTIVWRLGEPRQSCWYIPFFFWTFFHGQSVEITTKRKAFVIMLQILIFMLFVLGNAYQGLITSFMIAQPELNKLHSFDEVLESDYKVLLGEGLHLRMESIPLYQKAHDQGRIIIDKGFEGFNFSNPRITHCALVIPCVIAKYIELDELSQNFYVINENLFSYYVQLPMVYLSIALERWQLVTDWSFEAGLTKAWEKFAATSVQAYIEEEVSEIIKLKEISVIFLVLAFGCILGFLALLFEIFWHGCGRPYLERRKHLRENRRPKTQKRKLRVRKIKVCPAEVSVRNENEA